MSQENIKHISTAQLAKYLGISVVAVFKRIQKGRIKAVKIGRSYAIPESYIKERFPGFKFVSMEKGEYLSVMEAARVLGLSRATVFNRIKDGTISAKRVGRHYVIPKEEISKQVKDEPQIVAASPNEYFSVPQFAKLLGISRIAVFKRIKKGLLKANKVGRSFVIERKDVSVGEKLSETTTASVTKHISVKAMALRLGISRIAVFKKIQKGHIQAVKIGRSYVISAGLIEEGSNA